MAPQSRYPLCEYSKPTAIHELEARREKERVNGLFKWHCRSPNFAAADLPRHVQPRPRQAVGRLATEAHLGPLAHSTSHPHAPPPVGLVAAAAGQDADN